MVDRTCSVDGCDRPVHARRLCRRCYKRAEYYRDSGVPCSMEACEGSAWVVGLCRRCYKRAEYQRNRERYLKVAAEWSAANPDRSRQLKREHARRKRVAEPEGARARGRRSMAKWRALNVEEARVRGRLDYVKHREKRVVAITAWQKRNPERFRAIQRNREIRERNAPRASFFGGFMAVDARIKVEGLDELRAALRKADRTLAKEVGQAGKKAADIVAQAAKPKYPVRTGAARDSLRAVVVRGGGGVRLGGAKAPYAGFVEFGNVVGSGRGVGRGDSQPRRFIKSGRYLYPTLADRRDEVVNVYFDAMNDLLRRAGLR